MKNNPWRLAAGLLFAMMLDGAAEQPMSPMVNYQGRLADSTGSPFPTADYDLSFRIWSAMTDGVLVWGPQVFDGGSGLGHGAKVPVVRGYFNVILGPVDTNGMSLAEALTNTACFVEVTVSNRAPILPRQQILPAPYALIASAVAPGVMPVITPWQNVGATPVSINAIATAKSRRVGESVEMQVEVRFGADVTSQIGDGLSINIPYQIDFEKIAAGVRRQVVGYWHFRSPDGGQTGGVCIAGAAAAGISVVSAVIPPALIRPGMRFENASEFSMCFSVPVAGWTVTK